MNIRLAQLRSYAYFLVYWSREGKEGKHLVSRQKQNVGNGAAPRERTTDAEKPDIDITF